MDPLSALHLRLDPCGINSLQGLNLYRRQIPKQSSVNASDVSKNR
jgi:hypothetical protein